MRGDHGADDRQSKARTSAVAAAAAVRAVEGLEDLLPIAGLKAGAVVGDRELRGPVLRRHRYLYGRRRGRVHESVANEVADDLSQTRVVARDDDRVGSVQGDVALWRHDARVGCRVACDD